MVLYKTSHKIQKHLGGVDTWQRETLNSPGGHSFGKLGSE